MVEISLVPKTKIRQITLEDIGVIVVSGILGIAILASLSLFVYKIILQRALSAAEADLQAIEAKRDKNLENELRALKNKIVYIKPILDRRVYSFRAVKFIEDKTHPQVKFTELNIDLESNTFKISAIAPDSKTMALQFAIWEQTSGIKKISPSDTTPKDEGVTFSAELVFDPAIFGFSKEE